MSKSDPTDSALAAIASILDWQRASSTAPKTPEKTEPVEATEAVETIERDEPIADLPEIAHGYFKVSPGPMAALRFKWTVREDDGHYYVDETFGENSTPVVNGPMAREAAIRLVDDREAEARRRFENLKQEMTTRAAAANLTRRDHGEA